MPASLVLTVSTVSTHCYPFLKARSQSGELVSSSAQRLMFFILSLTENIPDTPACCFLMSSRRTTETVTGHRRTRKLGAGLKGVLWFPKAHQGGSWVFRPGRGPAQSLGIAKMGCQKATDFPKTSQMLRADPQPLRSGETWGT